MTQAEQTERREKAIEKIIHDLKILKPESWEHVIRRALVEAENLNSDDIKRLDLFDTHRITLTPMVEGDDIPFYEISVLTPYGNRKTAAYNVRDAIDTIMLEPMSEE
jgi:diphthamide synthase subunit DPH2